LFLTVEQLNIFSQYIPYMFKPNTKVLNQFNDIVGNSNDEVMHFLYLHYLTKRKDSKFWQEFKDKNKCPKQLVETLEHIKDGILIYPLFKDKVKTASFILRSHLYIANGVGLIKKKINLHDIQPTPKEYKKLWGRFKSVEV